MRISKLILSFFVFCFLFFAVYAQTAPDALRLYTDGKFEDAIQACKSEIEINPRNMDSYAVLCWSLIKLRQFGEANYWAKAARKIAPYDHRIVEILGEVEYYSGNNNEALSLFQEYVALVPNGARIGAVYYFMGEIYIRQNKFQSADIAFSASVRYEPQNSLWLTRLGYAREMAKNYKGSADAYEKALQLNPRQTDAQRGRERINAYL